MSEIHLRYDIVAATRCEK